MTDVSTTNYAPPAVCTECELIFDSPIHLGAGTTATLTGNLVTCPRCGTYATIANGYYEIVGGPDGLSARIHGLERANAEEVYRLLTSTATPNELEQAAASLNDSPGGRSVASILRAAKNSAWVRSVCIVLLKEGLGRI